MNDEAHNPFYINRSSTRGQWDYPVDRKWQDDGITITAHENGVLICVCSEHAVDSYNSSFESEVSLPWDRVDEMIDLLQRTRPS